jgi:hypothetical protein
MGKKGDTAFEYDPQVDVEFKEAEQKFDELKKSGHTMFSVDPETKETELVTQLFKTTPQVVAVPRIQGG